MIIYKIVLHNYVILYTSKMYLIYFFIRLSIFAASNDTVLAF